MDGTQHSSLSSENRKELYEKLREVWQLGANLIVGWRAEASGIELLYSPSLDLPLIAKRHSGLLRRDRHIGDRDRYHELLDAGCLSEVIPLSFGVSADAVIVEQMAAILRFYTVTHSNCRAVGLFDIVSFSHQSPFTQISQINILSYHANLAAACVEAAGLPIDLNMSTTGDGFYIWNRKTGLAEDLALFYVEWLVLAFNKAAMIEKPQNNIPMLRCCFGFGDHYEYYQASGTKPDSRGFIVGDVTVTLARLIAAALPDQFLLGSKPRVWSDIDGEEVEPHDASRIDMVSFCNFAQKNAKVLGGVTVGHGQIKEIELILTGDKFSERESTINNYEIVDKHGFGNRCVNGRLNITDANDCRISCGLETADLTSFQGRHVEEDDVTIKVI